MTKRASKVEIAVDESKASALDSFLKQMTKEHPGEVMRLNENPRVNIEVVPTGVISLDVAIGAGGFPRGKIIELYGGEGGGKCLVAGTYVWTDRGLETIEELFARCGQKASATTRVTDVTAMGVSAVNENGVLEQVAALTHNYVRPTWRVTVESGRAVEATANHPLRVLGEGGYIEWRNVSDIRPGDVLVSGLFGADEAVGAGLSLEEATLLGYLAAEGSLGQEYSFNFTNWDPEVRAEYSDLVQTVFGVDPVDYYGKELVVRGKALRAVLAETYGMGFSNADGKTVPYCVRTGGSKVQAAFLSALYEGDGWFHENKVGLASASRVLVEQVQLMLLGMGIPASLRPKWNEQYQRNYWNLLVSSSASARFLEQIGFRSERRAAQVAAHRREATTEPRVEMVPNVRPLIDQLRKTLGGDRELRQLTVDLTRTDLNSRGSVDASRGRLKAIVAWAESKPYLPAAAARLVDQIRELASSRYTFERVTAVEDAGEQPTFDLFVPETSSFLANGVLSHNTTVALTVAANAQKMGGNVGFIDAEHGLNRELCTNIGIDPERFVVFQPESGEKAIEMVEDMIKSRAFDVVIVDSVAAMTPQAEIDAEVDQQFMGLHARLMSRFMRKVAGPASDNGVMLILINQVRKNLAAYGTPDETTGGKAIKFYSSLRVEVRTSGSKKITKGSDVVGHTVTATIKKNRLGAPHTTAEFDLVYGKGVDGMGALLGVAEKVGVLSRAGAYYTEVATGERLSEVLEDGKPRVIVGKEAAKDLLRRDEAMRERIAGAVYAALESGAVSPDMLAGDDDFSEE